MDESSQALPKRSFSFWRIALTVILLGSICALVVRGAANRIIEQTDKKNEESILYWFKFTTETPRGLDPKFTDADDDLVADPPADPASRRSPDVLIFTFVAGLTAQEELADWKDFTAHLSRVTGKPVETTVFESTAQQLAALDRGTLHVTGFNTGSVPAAVATAGFVPVCTFGNDDGSFGIKMLFIVPADSPIKKLEDVKGAASRSALPTRIRAARPPWHCCKITTFCPNATIRGDSAWRMTNRSFAPPAVNMRSRRSPATFFNA